MRTRSSTATQSILRVPHNQSTPSPCASAASSSSRSARRRPSLGAAAATRTAKQDRKSIEEKWVNATRTRIVPEKITDEVMQQRLLARRNSSSAILQSLPFGVAVDPPSVAAAAAEAGTFSPSPTTRGAASSQTPRSLLLAPSSSPPPTATISLVRSLSPLLANDVLMQGIVLVVLAIFVEMVAATYPARFTGSASPSPSATSIDSLTLDGARDVLAGPGGRGPERNSRGFGERSPTN
ncbi:hypothetical protein DFJ73DRAFT_800413 [Zopfochytrium polystomum]|nr:hypothetical protein DFJ73DRAFT_800413 [Zopfochytrium polystomum]